MTTSIIEFSLSCDMVRILLLQSDVKSRNEQENYYHRVIVSLQVLLGNNEK